MPEPIKRRADVLVFTIAINGYQWLYAKHIESQRQYAKRWGYSYLAVERPVVSRLGVECCWLKLCLMQAALLNGYRKVLFVDADALIQTNAPALDGVLRSGMLVGMAKGYSGRFNSGVILAKRHPLTLHWLEQVLAAREVTLPESDSVGWGENGHIIHISKQFDCIQELSVVWNNTYDPLLDDYIRHFNHGPMRSSRCISSAHWMLSRLTHSLHWLEKQLNKLRPQPFVADASLKRLLQQVDTYYSLSLAKHTQFPIRSLR